MSPCRTTIYCVSVMFIRCIYSPANCRIRSSVSFGASSAWNDNEICPTTSAFSGRALRWKLKLRIASRVSDVFTPSDERSRAPGLFITYSTAPLKLFPVTILPIMEISFYPFYYFLVKVQQSDQPGYDSGNAFFGVCDPCQLIQIVSLPGEFGDCREHFGRNAPGRSSGQHLFPAVSCQIDAPRFCLVLQSAFHVRRNVEFDFFGTFLGFAYGRSAAFVLTCRHRVRCLETN